MRPVSSRSLLALCAASAALSLSACADVNGPASSAPKPVATLPANIASIVKTDVGEYLVLPRAGVTDKQVQATITQLKSMSGVGNVTRTKEGKVDLTFLGNPPRAEREAAVKQLAALGPIEEGI